jgi:hypothetical protein
MALAIIRSINVMTNNIILPIYTIQIYSDSCYTIRYLQRLPHLIIWPSWIVLKN